MYCTIRFCPLHFEASSRAMREVKLGTTPRRRKTGTLAAIRSIRRVLSALHSRFKRDAAPLRPEGFSHAQHRAE